MDLRIILLLIAALLVVISMIQPLAIRLDLSPSVLLAAVGSAMGLIAALVLHRLFVLLVFLFVGGLAAR